MQTPSDDLPTFSEFPSSQKPIVLITGLSGAGRSTALHVFEDLRLFTADGVPPSLMPEMVRLLQDPSMAHFQGLALGLDLRRGNVIEELEQALHKVRGMGLRPFILYFEADPNVIMRRYATTRRPHPLEQEGIGLEKAVQVELQRLAPIREQADRIIDTSSCSIHDLRRIIQRRWNMTAEGLHTVRVNLISFGFKYGVPKDADMIFDLRFLPNPYFVENLRPLTGTDKAVAAHVFSEPTAKEFKRRLIDFISYTLSLCDAEGRYRCTIGLGCTGGRHRSVAMTEALAHALSRQDFSVSVEHRHIDMGG